jgi:hypothetical protein
MLRFGFVGTLVLGIACFGCGCNNQADYKPVSEVKKAPPLKDHDHGEKGPHGGGIVELGEEEYHGEIVVDHDSHAVIVYILGKDAKTAQPVSATEVSLTQEGKTALTLKAAPQTGEANGKSSKFQLEDGDVVHELMEAGFIHGKLQITIADKPYTGEIDYHLDGSSHDDHDHK